MYAKGDYDVAGFCVGVVEKDAIIDGSKIEKDNTILAIPSSGFHSNGYSFIRKIFSDFNEIWNGKPLHEELLIPTRLYGNIVEKLLNEFTINGIAHITGGGLIENVPRIIPKNLQMDIDFSKIQVPEIMKELQKRGSVSDEEMFGSFNMGVGMVLVVDSTIANEIIKKAKDWGENIYEIGKIVASK